MKCLIGDNRYSIVIMAAKGPALHEMKIMKMPVLQRSYPCLEGNCRWKITFERTKNGIK